MAELEFEFRNRKETTELGAPSASHSVIEFLFRHPNSVSELCGSYPGHKLEVASGPGGREPANSARTER